MAAGVCGLQDRAPGEGQCVGDVHRAAIEGVHKQGRGGSVGRRVAAEGDGIVRRINGDNGECLRVGEGRGTHGLPDFQVGGIHTGHRGLAGCEGAGDFQHIHDEALCSRAGLRRRTQGDGVVDAVDGGDAEHSAVRRDVDVRGTDDLADDEVAGVDIGHHRTVEGEMRAAAEVAVEEANRVHAGVRVREAAECIQAERTIHDVHVGLPKRRRSLDGVGGGTTDGDVIGGDNTITTGLDKAEVVHTRIQDVDAGAVGCARHQHLHIDTELAGERDVGITRAIVILDK